MTGVYSTGGPTDLFTDFSENPGLALNSEPELFNGSQVPTSSTPGHWWDTTGSTQIPDPIEHHDRDELSIANLLWIYVSPIIFVFGLIGNLLILIVMGRRKFHGSTTSVYLRIMALADMSVLVFGMLPEFLENSHVVTFKEIHPIACKLEKFIHYSTGDTAIWILVAFTIDRFVAVCFPLDKTEVCKPRRAKMYCLGLLLVACIKNAHVFWTRGLEHSKGENGTLVVKSNCGRPTPEYKYFEKYVRPWIAFSLVTALPFIIILLCNICIIRTLIQAKKLHSSQQVQTNKEKTYMQMTVMCLSASFAFLLCIAPSIVILIGKPYWAKERNRAYDIAKAVNNELVFVNHSINFVLYCITGERFRRELIGLCRKEKRKSFMFYSSQDVSCDSRTTLYKVCTRPDASQRNGFTRLLKAEHFDKGESHLWTPFNL